MTAQGSRKWVVYKSDDDEDYGVVKDETIAFDTGFVDVTAANQAGLGTLPTGLKMRYLNCVRKNADKQTVRNKFHIGDPVVFDTVAAAGVITVEGVVWNISSAIGEKSRKVFQLDTEIDDGTDA